MRATPREKLSMLLQNTSSHILLKFPDINQHFREEVFVNAGIAEQKKRQVELVFQRLFSPNLFRDRIRMQHSVVTS